MTQLFKAYVPLRFFEKADAPASTRRRFEGFITTEHRDREGEIALQDGLDFKEFMAHGWFNDNHSKKTGANVGWPLRIERRTTPDGKKGTWVEGHLISGFKPADEIWDLAQALQRDKESKRQLGFSVEGTITHRGGSANKVITRAIVRNCAITANPVNPYTGMNTLVKALTAGGAVDAPAATPGEGFPLRTESLEGGIASQVPTKKKKKKKDLNKAVEQRLGRSNPALVQRIAAFATHLRRP